MFIFISTSSASAATIDVGAGYTYQSIASGVAAASSGDSVHVHSGTYLITSPIILKNGITIYGDGYNNTIIRSTSKSDFASESSPAMMVLTSCSNVNIYGLKFQGPASSIADIRDGDQTYYGGHDEYHNAIKLSSCSNINIHDCYFTLLLSDAIRTSTKTSSNVNIYNNIINTSGHDGMQIWNGKNFHIYNNYISVITNCAIRIANCAGTNITIDHNTMTNGYANSGWNCVQIQGSTSGLTVYHNVFTETTDNYAVTTYQSSASGCTIRDNVGYSCPSPLVYNCGGATAYNNTIYNSEYNWAAWGYGYSAASDGFIGGGDPAPATVYNVYNGSVLPTLSGPADGASVTPLNNRTTLTWSSVNSTNYRVQVDTDASFTNPTTSTTANNAITLVVNSSVATTYYWRVAAYNDANSAWTSYTASRSFSTVPPTTIGNTGVFGIIYDASNNQPISGATVTLTNDTWHTSMATNENGHYEFTIPYNGGTYYVSAVATDYTGTSQYPVTATYDYIEKDIEMSKGQTYFAPHFVKLVVTDKYLSARYNATMLVYAGTSTSPVFNDVVGDDGAVTLKMSEDSKYTIQTTYNAATQTDVIYPYDSMYYIVLDDNIIDVLPEQFYNHTSINVNKTEVNSTNAYVNVSYTDLDINQTTSVMIDIGNYDKNGTFVPVAMNQSFNKTEIIANQGNVTAAFMLTNYIGESYTVRIIIDHSIFGDVTKWYAVSFKGSSLPFDGKILAYFCVFMLFIVAMQFGRAEHATGAILLCSIFWLLYGLGVFDSLGSGLTKAMAAGGSLAVIYALAVYFNEKRREDGI